ncbi:molecular chaperone DnaJ [Streptosporangium sp. NBC_01755]|uniref:lipopolysaccharide kinase InaA family protein n=1 Tax=unclassified Streptosporangium TaxID=2632669 RepID=UPI002DD9167E|nr:MULTISPECIES: lipopolysaccharide kinase InaA family protein [unclassified Streptosporangium]WSA25732.1 molecular chaperone DnaJ [Streptosporangium sp. NBC_01810]WSD02878.1 molecular chaperone DnaJ [Streptosporangium sp. NBC_01755]
MTTTAEAIALVTAARTPDDLFGGDLPHRAYRRLARLLHPDLSPGAEAAEAFARLAELWAARGAASGRATGRATETVITTGRGTYRIGSVFRRGASAVLYESGPDTLLKLPRSHADNDLMRREADALETIARDGDPLLLPYVPRLVDSFRHRCAGVERRANVISRAPGGFVSLDEVRRRRPVLDARDVAWIWRRLLVAVGAAHRAGVVHGAVFGHHVLVHPVDHGLVLVDWSQSVPLGTPITALVTRHRDDYPPEVPARKPATPATDIHLATRSVAALMGGHAPTPIRRFVRGSLMSPPGDAWRLLGELDDLLDDLYGPRKYRPLHL